MPRKKKQTWDSYSDYLKSPEWATIKEDYAKNEGNNRCCIICTNVNDLHHHHFRYPKDWNDDSWENLILVCGNCHDILHRVMLHGSTRITIRQYMTSAVEAVAFENNTSLLLDYHNGMDQQDASSKVIMNKVVDVLAMSDAAIQLDKKNNPAKLVDIPDIDDSELVSYVYCKRNAGVENE